VELAKPRLRAGGEEKAQVQTLLHHVLETTLRLVHPVMPFITEEIWQALPHAGESIMIAAFPACDANLADEQAEAEMELLIAGTTAQRDLKASAGIPVRRQVSVHFAPSSPSGELSAEGRRLMEYGAATTIETVSSAPSGNFVSATVPRLGTFYLEVPEADHSAELAKIEAELRDVESQLSRTRGKLSNEQFLSRAPAEVVEKERRIAAELEEKKEKLLERKRQLS